VNNGIGEHIPTRQEELRETNIEGRPSGKSVNIWSAYFPTISLDRQVADQISQ
jgi:hypothetical protein